ncbi:MAG: sugar phosphate isomerase/epimerase [Clostridiales bacterium]|nr:sugar phosphate isomerase/epimerase [Clostridiales bacterium]
MGGVERADIANSNTHYRFYPFEVFLERQRDVGFRKVDLFGATPHVWIDAYEATDGKEIRKKIRNAGLETGVFIPEFSSMRYTLGSLGAAREKTRDYLKRCFEFASGLGCDVLVIGANGFSLDREEDERGLQFEESLSCVCAMARAFGMKIALENHFSDGTDMIRTIEDMRQCMSRQKEENLFVAVDTASVYEAKETLGQWFDAFGDRVIYVCLSNTRFDGARRYWGDGYLNLQELVDTLDGNGYRGAIGCDCMVREYLSAPWKADESTARMLDWVLKRRESK